MSIRTSLFLESFFSKDFLWGNGISPARVFSGETAFPQQGSLVGKRHFQQGFLLGNGISPARVFSGEIAFPQQGFSAGNGISPFCIPKSKVVNERVVLVQKFVKGLMMDAYTKYIHDGKKHQPSKFYQLVRDEMIAKTRAEASMDADL